jgi:hypothetical protein
MPGHFSETLALDLQGGTYKADWVDPASGMVINSVTFTHQGGRMELDTPPYALDLALRIKRAR